MNSNQIYMYMYMYISMYMYTYMYSFASFVIDFRSNSLPEMADQFAIDLLQDVTDSFARQLVIGRWLLLLQVAPLKRLPVPPSQVWGAWWSSSARIWIAGSAKPF